MAWADRGSTSRADDEFAGAATICAAGGEQSAGERGYAPFGRTDADFRADMFFNADPTVVADVTAIRNLDPCGDDASIAAAIAHDLGTLGTVTVPVELVYGADDGSRPLPHPDGRTPGAQGQWDSSLCPHARSTAQRRGTTAVSHRLELIPLPVADVDRDGWTLRQLPR